MLASDRPKARRAKANQSNARNSTGPRTESGKAISSRNALRHGLAVSSKAPPPVQAEALTNALLGSGTSPATLVSARVAADATIDLHEIMHIRTALVSKVSSILHRWDTSSSLSEFEDALDGLRRLDRYERRAISRRKNAIRSMDRDTEQISDARNT